MKITENNIIESLKSGEEQAFRYIYDKYYGYLCAIAKGCGRNCCRRCNLQHLGNTEKSEYSYFVTIIPHT